jgi:hypothetical protein
VKKEQTPDVGGQDDASAEAIRALAGQVATAAGQLIGLQMAVGALIESSASREAIIASIWSAWERIRSNVGESQSESHRLVLKSVQAVLQQIGVREPAKAS